MSSKVADLNGKDGNPIQQQQQQEPTEVEPCMGPVKTGGPNIFMRFQSDICERYNVTHRVFYAGAVLVCLLVVLVIVVIALGAAFPHIPHSQQFPVCKDAECLRGAAQIRETMNSTVDPCKDLWSWSCGGWLTHNPLPKDKSVWNQKQQLIRQESIKIRDLIPTLNLPLHVGSVEWKLKHFYEACLDVDNVNTDEARPLRNIISELGGWYILRDWSREDFDSKQVLKKLHVKYGVSPYFKITVEPDPLTPDQNTIRISPAGLGLPDRDYYYRDQDDRIQKAYKELIRDIIKYLSTTRTEAEKFANDMFSYEKRIAEITPSLQLLQDPIKTCNHVRISELKDTILTIPFYDILSAMYPDAKIEEDTEVIVTSLDYLSQISQIIASTERQTMNGYLIWTLVRHYLPYLSDNFTSVLNNFNAELYGIREPPKRWEFCADLVKNFMNFAVNSIVERANPATRETRFVVNETYASILTIVKQRLQRYERKPLLYKQLITKLDNMKLQVGLPATVLDQKFIKEYYSKLTIFKADLFSSVKYAIEFKKKIHESMLISPSTDYAIVDMIKIKPQIVYSNANNLIFLPNNLLTSPLFQSNYPKALIYGRLGVEIAEALISSVLPYNSFWTSNRKLLSAHHKTVEESLESINKMQKCLWNYILDSMISVPYDIANETALIMLKQLTAISVTNQALHSVSMVQDHIHQPALEEYEDDALFFLSYAQTQCSESTSQYQLYDNVVNFGLPQRTFLYLVWAQLPEFQESLDCYSVKKTQCSLVF